MKPIIYSLCILLASVSIARGATFTVVNSGFTFSPASLTVNRGDTIQFSLASIHNAVEVSQATWNAGGSTPLDGGFQTGFGGGKVVLTTSGVHYFVCQPHAGMGMKGAITVNSVEGVGTEFAADPAQFALLQNYPNPFNPATSIRYTLATESKVSVKVYNVLGELIATLADGVQSGGLQALQWAPTTAASGVYFVRLEAVSIGEPVRTFSRTQKILLQK